MRYRREYIRGGCYFFTVVTAKRRPILRDPAMVDLLREAFRRIRQRHPFRIDAMVVLPDHVHCIWTLPLDDSDYSTRWRLIKTYFTVRCSHGRPCWQKRFWEHRIRDSRDFRHHTDYIHYNPVKHGYVDKPREWPYSSFRRYVEHDRYTPDWGSRAPALPGHIGRE